MLERLNLPSYDFNFIEENKKPKIFDVIRKKYIVLTPEEWVRQNIIQFLVKEKGFPIGLMAVERGLKVNGMQKRTDILAYSKNGDPILMVECKASSIKINQATFDQISRYNINFKLPYLLVTNGVKHYFAKVDFNKNDYSFLKEIPNYENL